MADDSCTEWKMRGRGKCVAADPDYYAIEVSPAELQIIRQSLTRLCSSLYWKFDLFLENPMENDFELNISSNIIPPI